MKSVVEVEAKDLRIFPNSEVAEKVSSRGFVGVAVYLLFTQSFGLLALPISAAITVTSVLLAAYRNRILTRVVSHGFAYAFTFYRIVEVNYWSSTVLILGGSSLAFHPVTAKFQGLVMGAGLALYSLSGNWARFMAPWAIGRMSIEQFLMEEKLGKPNYSWLRIGMRHLERRLRDFGVSAPRSVLYLGASYAILNKGQVHSDLRLLGEWVGHSETKTEVLPSIQRLLVEAQNAEKAGFKPAPTLRDHLGDLPWQKISYATGSLAVAIGLIVALMRLFGVG